MDRYQRYWRWAVCAVGVPGTSLAAARIPWGTLLAVAAGTAVMRILLAVSVYTQPVPGGDPQATGPLPPLRSMVAAAALTAATIVAITGFISVFGGYAVLGLLVLAVTSPVVLRRVHRVPWLQPPTTQWDWLTPTRESRPAPIQRPRISRAARPQPAHPSAEYATEAATSDSISDAELCWRWRTSYTALEHATSPAERFRLISDRSALLDELAARNPGGFARWLDSGARAASDPARYVIDARRTAEPNRESMSPNGDLA